MSHRVLPMLLLASCTPVLGQSSGGVFTLNRHTIDNGGGRSVGGEFALSGTIGQPDTSQQAATGGPFLLSGGFWVSRVAAPTTDPMFLDGFEAPSSIECCALSGHTSGISK